MLVASQVGMTEQYLDRGQIGPVLQQVCGKTVPQCVGTHAFFEARVLSSISTDVPRPPCRSNDCALLWLTWK